MRIVLFILTAVVWLGTESGGHEAWAEADPRACDLEAASDEVKAASNLAISVLDQLNGDDCLGGRHCREPLCVWANEWYKKWTEDGPDHALEVEAIVLLGEVQKLADELPLEIDGVATVRRRLNEWRVDRNRPPAEQINELAERWVSEWQYPGSLILFEGNDDEVDTTSIVMDACERTVTLDDCVRVFRTQVQLLTLAHLQYRILTAFSAPQRTQFVRYLADLESRWQRYHLDARANLPWELWLNGRLLRQSDEGFIEPPEWQWVVLHPTPLLAMRGPTTDDMAAALGLELIGFYAWRWEGTEMRSPWRGAPGFLDRFPLGGSLLMGFDGDDDPGLGLVAHLPRNWSIGAMIDRGGEVTALVSVDVAKFFTDAGAQQRRLIEEFRRARVQ